MITAIGSQMNTSYSNKFSNSSSTELRKQENKNESATINFKAGLGDSRAFMTLCKIIAWPATICAGSMSAFLLGASVFGNPNNIPDGTGYAGIGTSILTLFGAFFLAASKGLKTFHGTVGE